MDLHTLAPAIGNKAVDIVSRLIGVLVLWVVGRLAIALVKRGVLANLRARAVDATLVTYADNVVNVLLNTLLVVLILNVMGVETTTFAGLLAAAGLAVGTAWSGLLSNFAAGAFLVMLRPFKKGDFVAAAGVTGTIEEIGMFVTTMQTPDNVKTIVGNNKIFTDTIQNFTANGYRRVDRQAQLAHDADHRRAIDLLRAAVGRIPNVLQSPAPDVEILDFTLAGPVLAIRPYCHHDHYWQVYFDTNRTIRETLAAGGFAAPSTPHPLAKPT